MQCARVPRAPFERLLCAVCVLYYGSKPPRVCKLTGSSGGPGKKILCFWPGYRFTGQVGDGEPSLPTKPQGPECLHFPPLRPHRDCEGAAGVPV